MTAVSALDDFILSVDAPERITRHKIYIHPSLKTNLSEKVEEKSQVIVHCEYKSSALAISEQIRIWKSTYLLDLESGKKCWLIHSENIAINPSWTMVPQGGIVRFTLFFEGLPKKCHSFDLVESIPEPGGFYVKDVVRNSSDIYRLIFRDE